MCKLSISLVLLDSLHNLLEDNGKGEIRETILDILLVGKEAQFLVVHR